MEYGADASAEAAKGPPPQPPALGARRLWRLSNLLMAIFFGLAGAVQVNDPDPGLWIITLCGGVCQIYIQQLVLWVLPFWGGLCLLMLRGTFCMKKKVGLNSCQVIDGTSTGQSYACLLKELFGLVIVTVWMGLCRNSAKNSLGGIRLVIAVSLSLFPFIMWLYIYVHAEMRASWPSHCKTVI